MRSFPVLHAQSSIKCIGPLTQATEARTIENKEVEICVSASKSLVAALLEIEKGLKVSFSSDQLDHGRTDQNTEIAL